MTNEITQKSSEKKLRAFAFRFNSESYIEVVRALARSGVEILYWNASKRLFWEAREEQLFSATVFHDTVDAIRAIPPRELSHLEFEPPSRELLKQLSGCEVQVYTMMNSIDPNQDVTFNKKKRLYHEYVRFWNGIFSHYKPDVAFFGDIPHVAPQFVAYHIAKIHGVQVRIVRNTQVTGRVIIWDDIDRYTALDREVEKNSSRKVALQDLAPDIQEYIKKAKSDSHATPFYMKEKFTRGWYGERNTRHYMQAFIKNVKAGTVITVGKRFIRWRKNEKTIPSIEGLQYTEREIQKKRSEYGAIQKRRREEYGRLSMQPDLDARYVYVALHNQPEATTSAMGNMYADQVLAVETLSAALPLGWKLYVKENPHQWRAPRAQTGRFQGYYERLARIPHVELVPVSLSTYELIRKSQCVASVVGTVTLEALLRGKSALIFGSIWFQKAPGVYKVSSVAEAKRALESIKGDGSPSQEKLYQFFDAFDRVTFRAYVDDRFKRGLNIDISPTENGRTIAAQFMKSLE